MSRRKSEPALWTNTRTDGAAYADDALSELERHDAQAAKLVKLRYFAGMTHHEAADALGIGRRAADRLWVVARAWLYQQMTDR